MNVHVGDILMTDIGNIAVVIALGTYDVEVGYYRDGLLKTQSMTYTMASKANRRFKSVSKDGNK